MKHRQDRDQQSDGRNYGGDIDAGLLDDNFFMLFSHDNLLLRYST